VLLKHISSYFAFLDYKLMAINLVWHNNFNFLSMPSNREISKLFSLYAELLLLHQKDERLATLLSGASYRLRKLDEQIIELNISELSKLFRPDIISIIQELKATSTIEALDELIQLTPQGLFEMMRIRGLGGKKLSILWRTAGIDSIDSLLHACKDNTISKIVGFGAKTQKILLLLLKLTEAMNDVFTMQVLLILQTGL
jgi:DNA polymerase (family 10)